MMLQTLNLVIYLMVLAIFVAAATATGAYLNRVMLVRRQAAMRVPALVKSSIKRNI